MTTVRDRPLVDLEHQFSIAFMEMERKGLPVDRKYAENYLGPTLSERTTIATEEAAEYGVGNINSTAQVAEALLAHGALLTKKTAKGKWSTDKEVLEGIAQSGTEAAPLAQAIRNGKTAKGSKVKYCDKVLASLDENDRCHPSHKSLQARTARTAVSDPPLHQLPSRPAPGANLWEIRRMFAARRGYRIIAVDFDQIELVVLAALSKDRTMLEAIRSKTDLHQLTADSANVVRDIGKMANFLVVYGGGAGKLAVQASIPVPKAKMVIKAHKRTYPGVGRLSRRIINDFHAGRRHVVTPTGRHLPIDRHKVYGGLNYLIQSTARDILMQACLNLREAGLWQYVILTVHDEVVMEVPTRLAKEIGQRTAEIMRVPNFMDMGVDITAGASKPVKSWGHLYDKHGEMKELGVA